MADLRELSEQGKRRYQESWQGRSDAVLWESVIGASEDGWLNSGLTRHYIRAYWTGLRVLTNQITDVQIGDAMKDGVSVQLSFAPWAIKL